MNAPMNTFSLNVKPVQLILAGISLQSGLADRSMENVVSPTWQTTAMNLLNFGLKTGRFAGGGGGGEGKKFLWLW